MQAYATQDYIEDILDMLRAQEVHFALVIGVPGENISRTFYSADMEEETLNELAEEMDNVLTRVLEERI